MSELIGSLALLDVARAGYGFAAGVHALFGLYLLLAWRGGHPGLLLFAAVALGAAWSGSAYLALGGDGAFMPVLASVFDALRIGAWFAFLLVLLTMLPANRQPANMLCRPCLIDPQSRKWDRLFVLPSLTYSTG